MSIYFSYFTTIDWHLWTFFLYHHRRFSLIGLLVQCLELAFLFDLQSYYFSQFSIQSQLFGLASRAIIFLSLAFRISFLVWLPKLLFFQFSVQSQLLSLSFRAIIFLSLAFRVSFLVWLLELLFSQYRRSEPILGDIFRFG